MQLYLSSFGNWFRIVNIYLTRRFSLFIAHCCPNWGGNLKSVGVANAACLMLSRLPPSCLQLQSWRQCRMHSAVKRGGGGRRRLFRRVCNAAAAAAASPCWSGRFRERRLGSSHDSTATHLSASWLQQHRFLKVTSEWRGLLKNILFEWKLKWFCVF